MIVKYLSDKLIQQSTTRICTSTISTHSTIQRLLSTTQNLYPAARNKSAERYSTESSQYLHSSPVQSSPIHSQLLSIYTLQFPVQVVR